MFSDSSTVVMQLPCCPGKQGELSENCLQNLRNDLMADSVHESTQHPIRTILRRHFKCRQLINGTSEKSIFQGLLPLLGPRGLNVYLGTYCWRRCRVLCSFDFSERTQTGPPSSRIMYFVVQNETGRRIKEHEDRASDHRLLWRENPMPRRRNKSKEEISCIDPTENLRKCVGKFS